MSEERLRYTVLVTHGETAWLAYIPTLGIVTQGNDPEEAFWMAQDAITGWIEIAIEDGLDIPVESESQVRQVAMRS